MHMRFKIYRILIPDRKDLNSKIMKPLKYRSSPPPTSLDHSQLFCKLLQKDALYKWSGERMGTNSFSKITEGEGLMTDVDKSEKQLFVTKVQFSPEPKKMWWSFKGNPRCWQSGEVQGQHLETQAFGFYLHSNRIVSHFSFTWIYSLNHLQGPYLFSTLIVSLVIFIVQA